MKEVIRVLIVDDSAFVRKVMREMLSRSPFIEVVGAARDGEEALELVASMNPDVVTLDLMMPRVDGVEFLRRQMAIKPVPVVVCSITHESGVRALEALEAGAVDFVQKPTALATDRVYEIADDLVAKVKAAATARFPAPLRDTPPSPVRVREGTAAARRGMVHVIVIGISTGGPQALRQMIPRFAADFPVPIVIVLHMPVGYTAMYAYRLNDASGLTVVEGKEDDVVGAGTVVIAPAGQHLTFARDARDGVHIRLASTPSNTAHRPSVDVLFTSAAEVYGDGVLGIVMTGMGNDGTAGAREIRARGGRVVTEAESSCVVYGMPRAAVEAGASDRVATLDEIPAVILEMI